MPVFLMGPIWLAAAFVWGAPIPSDELDVEAVWTAHAELMPTDEAWAPDLAFLGPLEPLADTLTNHRRAPSFESLAGPVSPSINDSTNNWQLDMCGPPRASSGLKLVARYTLEF